MLGSLLHRHGVGPIVTVTTMLAIGLLYLVPGLVLSVASSAGEPVSEIDHGRDLRAFMAAGELAAEREGERLYDAADPAYERLGAAEFVNPPWYAIAMIPIAWVDFALLWPIWAVAGALSLWWGVRRLDLDRSGRWIIGALLTLAGILTVFYGQNAFFMATLLAVGVSLLGRGSSAAGGASFALLAFKPHLLLGFVVWWLVELRSMWRVVAWATATTLALVVVSAWWLPGSWRGFFDTIATGDDLVVPAREVSLVSAVRLLVGDHSTLVVSLAAVGMLAVIVMLAVAIRRTGSLDGYASALAIVGSLLIAPRALAYDWMLLLVAAAMLLRSGIVPMRTVVTWMAWLGATLTIGLFLVDRQLELWDRAVSLAPLTLLAAFALLVIKVLRNPVDQEMSTNRS